MSAVAWPRRAPPVAIPPPYRVTLDLHGRGVREHAVYPVAAAETPSLWIATTLIACPIDGCDQTIIWLEREGWADARGCVASLPGGGFDLGSIRHRFVVRGTGERPELILDSCCAPRRRR